MAGGATPSQEVVLRTDRLVLRPWRVAEAAIQRELWMERDPRVPPHRRIDATGHPTVEDLEERIRTSQPALTGLLNCVPPSSRKPHLAYARRAQPATGDSEIESQLASDRSPALIAEMTTATLSTATAIRRGCNVSQELLASA